MIRDPYAAPVDTRAGKAFRAADEDRNDGAPFVQPLPPSPRDETIRRSVDALAPELTGLSHAIHDDPELGLDEERAVAALAELLRGHGVAVEVGVAGLPTALRAEVGDPGGPTVAVCSEYDALPGIGHGCGHNVICATGAGAFLGLVEVWERLRLPGRVILLGTPAEENASGKETMARAGAFDGIDAAIMVHPSSGVSRVAGPVLGLREVVARFSGRTAHASSSPYLGVNALDAAVLAYQAAAQIRQHLVPTDHVHGIFLSAGERPNIIPDHAAVHFYVRSATISGLVELSDRLTSIFEGAALASGTRLELEWDPQPPMLPVTTNLPLAERFAAHLAALGEQIVLGSDTEGLSTGSTDMGNVSQRLPAIHANVSIAPADVAAHTVDFAACAASPRADEVIVRSATALAQTAADVLSDDAFRAALRDEFDAGRGVDVAAVFR